MFTDMFKRKRQLSVRWRIGRRQQEPIDEARTELHLYPSLTWGFLHSRTNVLHLNCAIFHPDWLKKSWAEMLWPSRLSQPASVAAPPAEHTLETRCLINRQGVRLETVCTAIFRQVWHLSIWPDRTIPPNLTSCLTLCTNFCSVRFSWEINVCFCSNCVLFVGVCFLFFHGHWQKI